MKREIGVLLGADGRAASFDGECRLCVFQKSMGQWRELRSLNVTIDAGLGLKGLRQSIRSLVDFLQDCRIFVGLSVTGVLYYELEKLGCSVWEMSGEAAEFLDEVLMKEEENQQQAVTAESRPAAPELMDLGNGRYRISVKEIQENGTGMTSKQALIPIVRKKEFAELTIDCSHVPPWLECDLASGTLTGKIDKLGPKESVITIYNAEFGRKKA